MAVNAEWVQRRRAGESATQIALDAGVSESWVSACTVAAGPFPRRPPVDDALTTRWLADRRSGWSVASIARRDNEPISAVRRVTDPKGPFPRGHAIPSPDDPLSIVGLSRALGVADPTVLRWHRKGVLPPPDALTGRGHPRWTRATIDRWLELTKPPTCSTCGARPQSLLRHRAAVHR